MNKRQVRCFQGYAQVGNRFNFEVYYTVPDFYYTPLYICMACGEIFCADQEDIDYSKMDFDSVVAEKQCPKCSKPLAGLLKPYPNFFRTEEGDIGQFDVPRLIPDDSQSLVIEFWNLYS